jgi:hypothetical protein
MKRHHTIIGALAILAAASAQAATCPWPDPGANPYTGTPAAAIQRLADIPAQYQAELIENVSMGAGIQVRVTRDAILSTDGAVRYTNLRDMNFGDGRVCVGAVDRAMWPDGHIELATLYRSNGHVVLHFRRCNNVARATDPLVQAAMAPPPVARPSTVRRWLSGEKPAAGTATAQATAVPEPGTAWIVGLALLGIALLGNHHRKDGK